MGQRTIKSAIVNRFAVKRTTSAGVFLHFSYAIEPVVAPDVTIQLDPSVPAAAALWFDPLRRGIHRRLDHLKSEYIEVVGLLITISNIAHHDIDTTVRGCERVGGEFVMWFVEPYLFPLDQSPLYQCRQSSALPKFREDFLPGGRDDDLAHE